ncbi:hypothetical protein LV779_07585 [Streptomyces thinghirensis]|nr:hypothetical protein [Streptomyces thinghirensis]
MEFSLLFPAPTRPPPCGCSWTRAAAQGTAWPGAAVSDSRRSGRWPRRWHFTTGPLRPRGPLPPAFSPQGAGPVVRPGGWRPGGVPKVKV